MYVLYKSSNFLFTKITNLKLNNNYNNYSGITRYISLQILKFYLPYKSNKMVKKS